MDHRAVLADLPAATRAALTRRSDRAGLTHLALHLGALALTGGLIAARAPLWPALIPVHGLLLVFLFTLEHECTHKTPFATGWLNEALGHGAGLVLILPFHWFRAFHLAHHRFTNLPGQDPELAETKPESLGAWTLYASGLPYWAGRIRLVARLAAGRAEAPFIAPRARPRIVAEARILIVLYMLALASLALSPALLWLWFLPVLIAQPALRLYLLAEHGDCPQIADMLANSRTTFTHRTLRALAWNMPFHAEHHSYPAVPFYQLPRLHRLMRAHLKTTAPGYRAFTRAYLARRRGG